MQYHNVTKLQFCKTHRLCHGKETDARLLNLILAHIILDA